MALAEVSVNQNHQLAAEILSLLNESTDRESTILDAVPLLEDPDDK